MLGGSFPQVQVFSRAWLPLFCTPRTRWLVAFPYLFYTRFSTAKSHDTSSSFPPIRLVATGCSTTSFFKSIPFDPGPLVFSIESQNRPQAILLFSPVSKYEYRAYFRFCKVALSRASGFCTGLSFLPEQISVFFFYL